MGSQGGESKIRLEVKTLNIRYTFAETIKILILLRFLPNILLMILADAIVDTEPNVQNRPLESMQRQVTYSDLQRITNNFERILGKGGFGTVYYGCIDGIHVAVKVFSPSSVQGYQQFQAEASHYNIEFLISHSSIIILN